MAYEDVAVTAADEAIEPSQGRHSVPTPAPVEAIVAGTLRRSPAIRPLVVRAESFLEDVSAPGPDDNIVAAARNDVLDAPNTVALSAFPGDTSSEVYSKIFTASTQVEGVDAV